MRRILLCTFILFEFTLFASNVSISFNFKNYSISELNPDKMVLHFSQAQYTEDYIPFLQKVLYEKLSQTYSIKSLITKNCSFAEIELLKELRDTAPKVTITSGITNGNFNSHIIVSPFFIESGNYKKIISISVSMSIAETPNINLRKFNTATNSILSSGSWYKFKIPESGIYSISFAELSKLGILQNEINRSKISLWSNKSCMLPFQIGEDVMDDLLQLPLKFENLNNNLFSENSKFHFYAEAGAKRTFNESTQEFEDETNLYSDTNFVFLNVSSLASKEIVGVNSYLPTNTRYDYIKFKHHENEWLNFIKSGKNWVGEQFSENTLSFPFKYYHPISTTEKVKIHYSVCARSFDYGANKISLILNKDTVKTSQISKVSTVYYNDYVKFSKNNVTYESIIRGDSIALNFYYHQLNNQLAWLDYFSINSTERIVASENQFKFKLTEPASKIESVNVKCNLMVQSIWDVTFIDNVTELTIEPNDTGFIFNYFSDTIRSFINFNSSHSLTPIYESIIPNQNLHAKNSSNYLIITTPEFESQAKRLIDLHKRKDNLTGQIVFTEHIYNEFSSGRPEATAIRNFIKLIYKKGINRADSLKYVLLLGDGSYDSKNRVSNQKNFIPTFQSDNSTKLTSSYVTDDIYGLMDTGEGEYKNGDLLDLSIGRIPVSSNYEAKNVVDKILEYYNEYDKSSVNEYEAKLLTSKGSWKNNILFMADDEDFNEHMRQSNYLSKLVDTSISKLNIKKLFIDSYEEKKTSNGFTNLEANTALKEKLEDGVLLINYTGHGGELGWTDEKVFTINDIKEMKNRNRLPLFMTATCEFSRFDNPEHKSAGEYLLTQPQGGAIGLFTTVRLVFSIPNFKLNETFYKVLESSINNSEIRLGDVFKRTKVTNNGGTNDRNFALLGDPALKLAFPLNNSIVDEVMINNKQSDTIKSLNEGVIRGHISNIKNDLLDNYNGWAEILIFDKVKPLETLDNNNSGNPFSFSTQEDVLFRGRAEVINGLFNAKFYLPKDVRQDYDFGRISIYANDSILGDASGVFDDIIIGGTYSLAQEDSKGPSIEIFLDDSSFVFGDNVSNTPLLFADLKDSSGINLIPTDIGRDITLIIDENPELNYNLNEFYIPSNKTFKEGNIIFPIDKLKNGRHSMILKAYDNQNNSSQAYTEFIIVESPELALNYVLNYPNPFSSNTGFYFEHNQSGNQLKVMIQIYSVSGKLVKTINTDVSAENKRIGPIKWDGKDDFGDNIGRGVYIYKVKVQLGNGESEEELQKLVLIK